MRGLRFGLDIYIFVMQYRLGSRNDGGRLDI